MPEPLFSIVIAVRNGAATLDDCLDSIAAQTVKDLEVVVVDGASTDGTLAIIERRADEIAHWSSEPDDGICDAWNKALGHVRGDWVLFLGSDDRLADQDVLETVAERLAGLPGLTEVAYGRVDVVDESGSVIASPGRPWPEARTTFDRHNTIPHQAVFHRRSLFEHLGGFDRRFRIVGDYELLIRAFKDRDPVFIDVLVARFSGVGLSSRPDSMFRATREAYEARHVNGLERLPAWAAFRIHRAAMFELVRRTAGPDVARRLADRYHGRAVEHPRWGPPTA